MTPRSADAGFSLVEVLIVLAIISVLAGASLLALGGAGRTAAAEFSAETMANHLDGAVRRSMATGTVLRLSWDTEGYRISGDHPQSGGVDLPSGVRLDGAGGAIEILPDATGVGGTWRIAGASRDWLVTFDGLHARAQPVDR